MRNTAYCKHFGTPDIMLTLLDRQYTVRKYKEDVLHGEEIFIFVRSMRQSLVFSLYLFAFLLYPRTYR